MGPSRSLAVSLVALVVPFAVAFALVAPSPARAHGPTVELTAKGLEPVLLNLFEGTTVHFSNTLVAPEGLVVVDESGLLESPPLKQPGEGWHFTFDRTGSYVIHVRERPEATMRIVVVPKRAP
jgi:hypothetical protein